MIVMGLDHQRSTRTKPLVVDPLNWLSVLTSAHWGAVDELPDECAGK